MYRGLAVLRQEAIAKTAAIAYTYSTVGLSKHGKYYFPRPRRAKISLVPLGGTKSPAHLNTKVAFLAEVPFLVATAAKREYIRSGQGGPL